MTIQLGNFCCPDSARQVKHADHNKYKKYKQIDDEVQNPVSVETGFCAYLIFVNLSAYKRRLIADIHRGKYKGLYASRINAL